MADEAIAHKAAKKKFPTSFGQTFKGSYPEEMRLQLWPLCCGASIISGFKQVNTLTDEELVEQIEATCTAVADFQVYAGEQMRPKFTFLTLNESQMQSKKIMSAIDRCGFFKIGQGRPRGSLQGFFLRDATNGTWEPTGLTKRTAVTEGEKAAA